MCSHSETGINWHDKRFCLLCGDIIEGSQNEVPLFNMRAIIFGIRNAFRRYVSKV